MSDFVARERTGSAQAVIDMAATVSVVYQRALKHDEMPPDTKFAVFSNDNPFVPFYEKALTEYREMLSAFNALGYVGLRVSSRDVYSRKRRKA